MGKVKCLYCGEIFDRDKIKHQKIGRRYAHLTCNVPTFNPDKIGFDNIIYYANEILSGTVNHSRIGKQIKSLIESGLTYNDIYLTLKYWFEVKKGDPKKANGGIGIVPYVCQEAKKYWSSMEPTRIPKIEEEKIILSPKKRKKIMIGEEVI